MKLTVSHLSKSYQQGSSALTVLRDVTAEFPSGHAVAIVGRSGTGKSTLLHLLGGLDHPDTGSVLYDETDIFKLSDEERSAFRGQHIGFVFQFHHLLAEFTALENVTMPLLIRGVPERRAVEEAAALLERVGLNARGGHRPSELSGGEQQRVAVARALVTKPSVVLADEPTGNLDPAIAEEVVNLLVSVSRELSSLLVVVTHSRELARKMDFTLEMQPGGALAPLARS